jgi:lipoprotein-anchoring transpeptidase ErfK/SrfK
VDSAVRAALAAPSAPQPSSSGPGLVAEVNESQQVLLVVDNGAVQQIFNTSTGTEEPYTYEGREYLADTPNGSWTIYRQIDGWRESNLGRLYRPKYFHEDGIAIHGYPNVPAHPASHGCVRVSMAAMDYLWGRLPIGTPVLVY